MTDAYRTALRCVERGWPVSPEIIKQLSEQQLRSLLYTHEQVVSMCLIGTMNPGGEPSGEPGLQLIEEGE